MNFFTYNIHCTTQVYPPMDSNRPRLVTSMRGTCGCAVTESRLTVTGFPQKSENRIPRLFHDWFASFHDSHSHMVSDIVMIVSHNMHDNHIHKLESCHSHENKNSMTFPWLFGRFSYSKTFPWLSMTAIFSRIFHDRGNPAVSVSVVRVTSSSSESVTLTLSWCWYWKLSIPFPATQ